MQRFLIIQLRQVGDVVLTTPLAAILKEQVPDAHVSFLTEAPCDQLLHHNPHVDQVLLNNRRGGWRDTLKVIRQLRAQRFHVLLDGMANPRSALLARLSGTPVRISYAKKGRGRLYTHQVPPQRVYATEYKKLLLGPLQIHSPWNRPEIFLTAAEAHDARDLRTQLLQAPFKRLVTIDPSHRRITRRWPVKHYAELCRAIADRFRALPVVLWGPGEEATAAAVVAGADGRAVVAPATNLRQLAALIAVADLHVGNCSAPRHMAVAVGTPSFTILGSTSSGWTYPSPEHTHMALGLECQPCNKNQCAFDLACLHQLAPAAVFKRLSDWCTSRLGWSLS